MVGEDKNRNGIGRIVDKVMKDKIVDLKKNQ